MKKSVRFTVPALALSVLLGTTGCFGSSEPEQAPAAAVEQNQVTQPQDTAERVTSGYAEVVYDYHRTDVKASFTDSAPLHLNAETIFVLKNYAVAGLTSDGAKAPAGEVLHAVDFTSEGNLSAEVEVLVDGKAVETLMITEPSGTVIVSAPKDAEVQLAFLYNDAEGVKQVIDMKTAERVSKGIAEAWYQPSENTITNDPSTVQSVGTSKVLATYEASVTKATKTPYSLDKGWADKGKQAWLVLETPAPSLTLSHGSHYEEQCSIKAVDATGAVHSTEDKFSTQLDHAEEIHFLVPAESNE